MKAKILIPLLLGLASAPLYASPYHHGFEDRARVVAVTPIMERVEVPVEREACWQEEVQTTTHDDSGLVLGGIIGGVIGHNIGHGRDRAAATVAGSVIGAAIGHDADRHAGATTRVETRDRCRVRTEYVEQERLRGYRVSYRYHGQTYTTEMDHEPGRFIPVRVAVTPVD